MQSSSSRKDSVAEKRVSEIDWFISFLPFCFYIALLSCCSVSIFLWRGLLLGRGDHFQQESLWIRATCRIVPAATNDYQCIRAGLQCRGQRGAWGWWWRRQQLCGGGWVHAPRRQRVSSLVAALNPHITSLQSTKSLTHHVLWDEINLLWEADAVCLEAGWGRSQRVQ